MKKPLVVRSGESVIVSFNGKKIIKSLKEFENMTDDEIAIKYISTRNIKNNRV